MRFRRTRDSASVRDGFSAYRDHRRKVRAGQILMAIGVVVAAIHAFQHLAGSPSGATDLLAGYPAAGGIFMIGAILAGRAEPKRR